VIRPESIPLIDAPSRVVLPPDVISALFGPGYRPRGTERVRISAGGQDEVLVVATIGPEFAVFLDGIDRAAIGAGPHRVCGPHGHIPIPKVEPVRRVLVLPAALRKAWGVPDMVTIQAGLIAFGGVAVDDGPTPGVRLDRADRLVAGLAAGDTVRWRRDVDLGASPIEAAPDPRIRTTGRLITETDVRQARLRGQRIVVRPGQIVTPAAQTLGRELGVIDPTSTG
jgi:hypothetical protein